MRIEKDAFAGTLESSDVLVKVEPHDSLEVVISSTVLAQYGDQIDAVVRDTLTQLDVPTGMIIVDDKGALDCTIRARVQGAVARASQDAFDWSRM